MIEITNLETYGWETAIRGMRNPKNSWDKSDSFGPGFYFYVIGPNDLKLMEKLAKAGDDHGKFMRMLTITCDITAPLYWWKEFDTYKVGTVADSCSTMHKLADKELELSDFSCEHLSGHGIASLESTITTMNYYREKYWAGEERDKNAWWQMVQLLPSSYNQKRTVQFNYQVARHMWHARHHHRLNEWVMFCAKLASLPYAEKLITS